MTLTTLPALIMASLNDVTPVPTPAPTTPSCQRASDLCQFVWERTGQAWLAESSYYLVVKPFTILMIFIGALVARYVLHRLINKAIGTGTDGEVTGLFKPLHDRLPASLQEATGLRSERHRQRAQALASVLRSLASTMVFGIAVLMILSEVGMDLAPLLASAGVAGVAIGFGAQNVVKDFLSGLFMLLEDQYGVGDVIDVGDVNGTVVAVGLRITTLRDPRGVLWYIRNGEIVRVGNKSQGWALVVVDVPIGFASVEDAARVMGEAAATLADDPDYADVVMEPPTVLGVEQITVDGAVVRTTVKTTSDAQWRVGRDLRRRLSEALERAGISQQISAGRVMVRPATPVDVTATTDPGVAGPT